MSWRNPLKQLCILFLLLMVAGALPLFAQDETKPEEPLPEYLEELKALAKKHLEATDTDGAIPSSNIPAGKRVRGPISREEYSKYVGGAAFSGYVETDSVSLTRPVIPRVVIMDRNAIEYLFDCCAYEETHPDSVDFIEIYDFSRSGFSNGDMMVVHPSGNSYILDNLDADFLDSAASWEKSDNLVYHSYHRETTWMDNLIDELSPPEYYDWQAPLPEMTAKEEEEKALRAMWGDVHRAVDTQYGVGPLELYFARDDSTTTIEFWGYEPDDLNFQFLGAGQGQGRNDLLTVSVSDTLVTAYQTYVDVLVISDSRRDTVFVSGVPEVGDNTN